MTSDHFRRPAPVPIRTPRLVLRPPREGDGAALAEAVDETWDDLHPWFHPWMRARGDEADPVWQEVVACRALAAFKARERLRLLAWEGGRLMASLDLIHLDWDRGTGELTYWVRRAEHRRGIGLEAAGALTRWAFGALGMRRVTVGHVGPNAASAALIARLGFAPASRMPMDHAMPDGTLVDGLGHVMTDPARLPPLDLRWGA